MSERGTEVMDKFKPWVTVKVEVLEQAIKAMEGHDCPRCEAALFALYAAVQGSGEGGKRP